MGLSVGCKHVRIQVVPQQTKCTRHRVIELDGLNVVRQEPATLVEGPVIVRAETQKVAHLVRTLVAKCLNMRCLRHWATRRHEEGAAPLAGEVVEGLHCVGDADSTGELICSPLNPLRGVTDNTTVWKLLPRHLQAARRRGEAKFVGRCEGPLEGIEQLRERSRLISERLLDLLRQPEEGV